MANQSEDMSSCYTEYSPTQLFYYKNNKPCFYKSCTYRTHRVNIGFVQIYWGNTGQKVNIVGCDSNGQRKKKVVRTRVYL